jgi:hypothetical protein
MNALRLGSAASALAAVVLLGSVCGQSSKSTTTGSTPVSGAPAESPPPGGSVPDQLLGDWLLPAPAAAAIAGSACAAPVTVASCTFKLTFTATTYNWTTNVSGFTGGGGGVVVKGSEIDFFSGAGCGLKLPEGVGRYMWTFSGGGLSFTAMSSDGCPRSQFLAGQTYSRTG